MAISSSVTICDAMWRTATVNSRMVLWYCAPPYSFWLLLPTSLSRILNSQKNQTHTQIKQNENKTIKMSKSVKAKEKEKMTQRPTICRDISFFLMHCATQNKSNAAKHSHAHITCTDTQPPHKYLCHCSVCTSLCCRKDALFKASLSSVSPHSMGEAFTLPAIGGECVCLLCVSYGDKSKAQIVESNWADIGYMARFSCKC